MAAIWVRASATRGTIQTADDIVILPSLPRRTGSAPASRRDRWPARSAPGEWPSDRPAWDQPRRHPRSRRETPRTPPLHPPLGSGPARRSAPRAVVLRVDRKSTRLNSSHSQISYAVFCLKKKKKEQGARILSTNQTTY